VLVENLALVGELLDRAPDEVPVLGEAGRSAQSALLTVAADADWRMRPLDRLGVASSTRQLVVGPPERGRVVREEADDDFTRLFEAVAALLRVPTEMPYAPDSSRSAGSYADLEATPETMSSVAAMLASTAGCR